MGGAENIADAVLCESDSELSDFVLSRYSEYVGFGGVVVLCVS